MDYDDNTCIPSSEQRVSDASSQEATLKWTIPKHQQHIGMSTLPSLLTTIRRHSGRTLRQQVQTCRNISNAAFSAEALKSRLLPIPPEALSLRSLSLLYRSLQDFLPVYWDTPSKSWQKRYDNRGKAPPGFHLIFNVSAALERDLLEDGTDILHAPDRSWQHRLWAGGSLRSHSLPNPRDGQLLLMVERIAEAKMRAGKAFVKIQRVTFINDGGLLDYAAAGLISTSGLLRDKIFPPEFDGKDRSSFHDPRLIFVADESRWLCFTKEPVPAPTTFSHLVAPPTDRFYTVSLTPTRNLLFRFSALTFNAHRIHLDAEYTRRVYNHPDLLVHGPLILYLMLQAIQNATGTEFEESGTQWLFQDIDYMNHAPLYANQCMTIGCTRPQVEPNSASEEAILYVWIEKIIDGEPKVCVQGKVLLKREAPSRINSDAESSDEDDGKHEIDGDEANEFDDDDLHESRPHGTRGDALRSLSEPLYRAVRTDCAIPLRRVMGSIENISQKQSYTVQEHDQELWSQTTRNDLSCRPISAEVGASVHRFVPTDSKRIPVNDIRTESGGRVGVEGGLTEENKQEGEFEKKRDWNKHELDLIELYGGER